MTANSTITVTVNITEMPDNITLQEMPVFDEVKMIKTLVLGTLFFVSVFGNLATIIQMYKMRRRKSTINTLIINLATADLLVTFFCMGAEAIWSATVQWYAGEFMCKFVKFAQVVSNNLSTYITVVISLDRCCVILYPMSRNKAPKRVRNMIITAWCLCAIFSIPQIMIFQVKEGPWVVRFVQCMEDYGIAKTWGKKVYNIVSVLFSFVIPLLIMGTAYGLISGTIARKMRDFKDQEMSSSSSDTCTFQGHVRSDLFRKAKRKALRMSIVIVAAFIVCWTPYYVLFTCFTFFDIREMPQRTMLYLSFIGLSNSLLNPIIYGAFHLCNVHSPRSERRRSFRRKDWPSFSLKSRMYQRRTGRKQEAGPDGVLELADDCRYAVVKPRQKFVVICHCENQSLEKELTNPCLYVLYKVEKQENSTPVVDSLSSV